MKSKCLPIISVALAAGVCGSPALAANEFLYVVNASGRQVGVMVDYQTFPPMDHLMALAKRVTPGKHELAAATVVPTAAINTSVSTKMSVDLAISSAVRDRQNRTFWCFLVAQLEDKSLAFVPAKQADCANLIERGVGDRPLK